MTESVFLNVVKKSGSFNATDRRWGMKMKKKVFATLLALFIAIGGSRTVLAAPEIMPDGTIFDAEYYAEMYPDVVNALGNDLDVLYQHYLTYGKNEGRKASADDTAIIQETQNTQGTVYTVEDIKNKNKSSYTAGTKFVYGPKLTQKELDEVAQEVTYFMNALETLPELDTVEKTLVAHNYLAQICSYAETWEKNRANTAWGALVYKETQCSGYARAKKALCDTMGVNCVYVHSDNSSHQWNMVEIDGVWYVVDVTFDDSSYGFYYFLCGSEFHEQSYDTTQYPICSEKGYDIMPYYEKLPESSSPFFYIAASIR